MLKGRNSNLPRERLSETILQTVKLDAMICPFRGNAERAFLHMTVKTGRSLPENGQHIFMYVEVKPFA